MASREKLQNIIFLLLGVWNIVIYILVLVAAIVKAIDGKMAEIIQCVYCVQVKTLDFSDLYLGFLGLHAGKGCIMLFLGCVVMCESAFNIIVSIFGFTLGLAYIILSFVPLVPLPSDLATHWKQYHIPTDEPDLPCQYYASNKPANTSTLILHPSFLPTTAVHPATSAVHY
ncbi:hypothetical protein BC940DRAFT_364652 [Gongronella butleri]|nr:hypothetical protein BC940DRAFT_364652 [Gongronella butleri]